MRHRQQQHPKAKMSDGNWVDEGYNASFCAPPVGVRDIGVVFLRPEIQIPVRHWEVDVLQGASIARTILFCTNYRLGKERSM